MRFDVVSDVGSLGERKIVVGNVELDRADFAAFLMQGVKITSASISIDTSHTTVDAAVVSADATYVLWKVHAYTSPEDFTLTLVVNTNDGQQLHHKIAYSVVALQVS